MYDGHAYSLLPPGATGGVRGGDAGLVDMNRLPAPSSSAQHQHHGQYTMRNGGGADYPMYDGRGDGYPLDGRDDGEYVPPGVPPPSTKRYSAANNNNPFVGDNSNRNTATNPYNQQSRNPSPLRGTGSSNVPYPSSSSPGPFGALPQLPPLPGMDAAGAAPGRASSPSNMGLGNGSGNGGQRRVASPPPLLDVDPLRDPYAPGTSPRRHTAVPTGGAMDFFASKQVQSARVNPFVLEAQRLQLQQQAGGANGNYNPGTASPRRVSHSPICRPGENHPQLRHLASFPSSRGLSNHSLSWRGSPPGGGSSPRPVVHN